METSYETLCEWDMKHVMMVQRQKASPKISREDRTWIELQREERKGQDNLGQGVA